MAFFLVHSRVLALLATRYSFSWSSCVYIMSIAFAFTIAPLAFAFTDTYLRSKHDQSRGPSLCRVVLSLQSSVLWPHPTSHATLLPISPFGLYFRYSSATALFQDSALEMA